MNLSNRGLLLFALASLPLLGTGLRAVSDTRPSLPKPVLKAARSADEWRSLAWLDENGKIPPNALNRAIEQKARLAHNNPGSISPWVEQGPNNVAGRTCCLAIDPSSPLTMWMGAAGGGIWRSYDGGTTWTPVGDQLKSLAVNALTLDPNNSNTLYAGTGEGYYNLDAIGGFGIFKSSDGGTTWAQLPATANFAHVNRIAVDPNNSQIMLVSVQPGGFYRTADGGASWSQVLSVESGQAVAFCPSNTNRAIGSVLDYDQATSSWFTSAVVSNDAGKTWAKATGGLNALQGMGRIETWPLVADANTVFASASDGNIWKSTNGGVSYSEITVTGNSGASLTANAIWVDPTDSTRVVVGGQDVFESTDGGMTLNLIGTGGIQTSQPHPGVHALVASPAYDGSTNKSLFVCTSGGVYEATDITSATTTHGWLPRYQGIRTSQFYSVAGDGVTGLIIGGLQDNGVQSLEEGVFIGSTTSGTDGLDGGFVAIDPSNPSNVYGETGSLQVFQSTDGGLDAKSITNGLTDAGTVNCNYIAPLVFDPNNSKVLLAGGASLWRCSNAGSSVPTWSPIRSPGTAVISAIAVAPGNSSVIWVGQNDGTIAMTSNGTAETPTWTTISGPTTSSPIPNRYITRLLVDPGNTNTVYATLGGFTPDNVWETTDGGTTWNAITGAGTSALPEVPVRAIARAPGSPNSLFVGTEVGVFSTSDGGRSWTTSSDLNVNVSVDELTYMNNSQSLLAATHGRGVWILPAGTTTVTALTLNPTSVLGGSTSQGTVTLSQVATGSGVIVTLNANSSDAQPPATVTVPAGRTAATFTIETNGVSGEETATIDAVLGTSHKTAALTITPATLSGLSLSPTSVVGGNSCTGTVTLSGPAPPQGAFVALQSSLGQATLPANVTIPGGATTATFTVKTIGVSASTTTTISGILGGKTLTANLVIQPATIQSFTLAPSTVAGGNPTIGTVTLNGNAPFGGAVIKLASNVKTAILPASVTIAAGSTNGTVSIGTTVVTKPSTATLTATLGASSQTAALLIEPTALQSVSVAPSTVIGGSNTPVVGAVTLTGPASASGMTVTLSSSNSKAASVPASVRVAAGKTSATFAVSHALTASIQTSVIKATAGAATETATLTISPMMISSLNLNPSTVAGGFNSSGVITLNATLASHGGPVTIKLTANSGLIKIPPAVSVPAGANSSKFTIATTPVALTQSAGITSTLGAGSQTASLTIEPPTLASLVLKPTSVKGSSSTPVTGMVTLTSPAPAGGIEILLSSSSTAASTPATIIVSAGKLSAVFTVKHGKVSILTAVTISAKLNGTIKTTVLAVTP